MTKFQENAENAKETAEAPTLTNDQLEGLLYKHSLKNSKQEYSDQISRHLFKRIREGKIQVTLNNVYYFEEPKVSKKISDNRTGPFLARLYSMEIIECDNKGYLSFTKKAKNLFKIMENQHRF